jgi:glycosyltransferase involved in cell wall biosynthesis
MNDARDTLLILSPGFPANESDTNCLPAQQALVRSLSRCFPALAIHIIAFQYPYRQTQYSWYGIPVTALGGSNRGGLLRLRTWIHAWRAMRKIMKQQPVTGILSFWAGECALMGHFFARRHKIRHASWILGQDARKPNPYLTWFRPHPESLIAMSDFLAKQFHTAHGIRPAYIVPNGIDPSLFPAAHVPRNMDILGAGSLIELKRFDIFIHVANELFRQLPGLTVTLCGDGPERKQLEALARQQQPAPAIHFAGELPHSEMPVLMQRSRLFLHTSSYEGFSGACLEALYAGAHVVSFCRPQDAWIRHWHIVDSTEEMIAVCLSLLQNKALDHTPILPYHMDDSARQIMEVFSKP